MYLLGQALTYNLAEMVPWSMCETDTIKNGDMPPSITLECSSMVYNQTNVDRKVNYQASDSYRECFHAWSTRQTQTTMQSLRRRNDTSKRKRSAQTPVCLKAKQSQTRKLTVPL